MRIRSKLVIALLIPLLALGVLSAVAISSARESADDAAERSSQIQAQVDLASASTGPGGVVIAIQSERNTNALEILGLREALGLLPVDEQRALTDESIEGFRSLIAGSSETVQQAYGPALDALATIDDVRDKADGYDGPKDPEAGGPLAAEVFDDFSTIINTVFDLNSTVALGLDDPELRSGARYIDQIMRLVEHRTVLLRTIALPIVDPSSPGFTNDPEAFGSGHGLATMAAAIEHDLLTSSTDTYKALAEKTFADPAAQPFFAVTGAALAGQEVDITELLSDETSNEPIAVWEGSADVAAQRLQADAAELIADTKAEQDDAERRAQAILLGSLLVMLAGVAVALAAARSIAVPLRRLVGDAEDMAGSGLPDAVQSILEAPLGEDVKMPELKQVSPKGGAEIAEVAAALNSVQDSAAGLATEQALLRRNISDSFVNLGRRNQNLLSRQLDSITEMEREESDPAALDKLFTLDHLATRMRRNAESLLLLAGLEPHRQWSAPVALIDVIRGALGEVEEYSRVEVTRFDEAIVNGSTAADLTHLVAELLENALNFSPPGRSVEISGAARDGGYTLAIIDNGIGMEPEELDQANVRLSGGESFTVAPSRYLGHYVVGIQAARLGTPVLLQDTPTGGVTAMIDVTAALATDQVPSSDPAAVDADAGAPGAATPSEPSGPPAVNGVPAGPTPAASPVADRPARDVEPVRSADPAPAEPDQVHRVRVDGRAPAAPNGSAKAAPTPEHQAPAAPVKGGAYGATAAGAPSGDTTPSGYRKRVRGTHAPRTDVVLARGDQKPEQTAPDTAESSADRMRSMLSGLKAGSDRAQAEVDQSGDESTEDPR
ncbi:MAG: hypothetical protein GX643_07565 [Acidimicrobiales bacterium]|nr:hypothetical protein [Acidimicrobiales bacterium]